MDGRTWPVFTSSDGSPKCLLAAILADGVPQKVKKNLPDFDLTTQGALVKRNVDQSYDRT